MFRRVRFGSPWRRLGSSGSFKIEWFHTGEPSGRRVRSVSRGFSQARLGVVGFCRVRVDSLGRAYCSS